MTYGRAAADGFAEEVLELIRFQADSLEAAHQALEVERRSYQEQFDGGPDDLVGELLPSLVLDEHQSSLQAAIAAFALGDWAGEWIGEGITAGNRPLSLALTAAVVRHTDGSVYRLRWSLRDVSRRPESD